MSNEIMQPSGPNLLLIADDLMIPARVREGAKPLSATVRVVATEEAMVAALTEPNIPPIHAVLITLTARRFEPGSVIRRVKTIAPRLPVLAFAGHVEQDKHQAAREAGADKVAANSSVALHLPALLQRLLKLPEAQSQEPEGSDEAH
jgi:CheY-like chemotaxis protein